MQHMLKMAKNESGRSWKKEDFQGSKVDDSMNEFVHFWLASLSRNHPSFGMDRPL